MPRHDNRGLPPGRLRAWTSKQSHHIRLNDGTEIDMGDPDSIRAYVRNTIANMVEPTAPQLRRLEMLSEMADKLPPDNVCNPASRFKLIDPRQAVEVLYKRADAEAKLKRHPSRSLDVELNETLAEEKNGEMK
jgi:hypothetical protein